MTDLYSHTPHPHIEARKTQGPVKIRDTRTVNDRLGLKITRLVGTMWCAYLFCGLAVVSLPSIIQAHSVPLVVSWIAQTFLQLVLLSVILVGQNLTSAAGDKRAEQTYNDAEAVLAEALKIQDHLAAQDELLTRMPARLLDEIPVRHLAPFAPANVRPVLLAVDYFF